MILLWENVLFLSDRIIIYYLHSFISLAFFSLVKMTFYHIFHVVHSLNSLSFSTSSRGGTHHEFNFPLLFSFYTHDCLTVIFHFDALHPPHFPIYRCLLSLGQSFTWLLTIFCCCLLFLFLLLFFQFSFTQYRNYLTFDCKFQGNFFVNCYVMFLSWFNSHSHSLF